MPSMGLYKIYSLSALLGWHVCRARNSIDRSPWGYNRQAKVFYPIFIGMIDADEPHGGGMFVENQGTVFIEPHRGGMFSSQSTETMEPDTVSGGNL